jgi:hypothetical protein
MPSVRVTNHRFISTGAHATAGTATCQVQVRGWTVDQPRTRRP